MRSVISIIIFFITIFMLTPMTFATTPSPSPTPTNVPKISEDPKNIDILNELKNKIASKVAQLNLVQRKGTIGTITSISGTQIIIKDIHEQEIILDVDELTKFSSPAAKTSFGISDLTNGSVIDVLGLYNKQSKHILVRFIDVITLPRYIHGQIASIDKENFVVTVISEGGKMTPIDIETITKTSVYTKEEGKQKGGFSKIKQGGHITVVGYANVKDKKRIVASRILLFPQIPPNPRIIIPQQALDPDAEIIPSTGSGKTVTPITR
jgi:hypothetical protein